MKAERELRKILSRFAGGEAVTAPAARRVAELLKSAGTEDLGAAFESCGLDGCELDGVGFLDESRRAELRSFYAGWKTLAGRLGAAGRNAPEAAKRAVPERLAETLAELRAKAERAETLERELEEERKARVAAEGKEVELRLRIGEMAQELRGKEGELEAAKGSLRAVEKLLPGVENRRCRRFLSSAGEQAAFAAVALMGAGAGAVRCDDAKTRGIYCRLLKEADALLADALGEFSDELAEAHSVAEEAVASAGKDAGTGVKATWDLAGREYDDATMTCNDSFGQNVEAVLSPLVTGPGGKVILKAKVRTSAD